MTPDSATTTATPPKPVSYWRRTRRLTATLLAVWFAVTLATVFFARELSDITLFGWPLSFYMAAQGTTLIYLLIVGIYAWRMKQLEQTFRSDQSNGR